MSLINDALKRASNAKPPAASNAPLGAPLQPVEEAAPKFSPLPMILCITGVGALAIAGGFWLKSKGTLPTQEPLTQVADLSLSANQKSAPPSAAAEMPGPSPDMAGATVSVPSNPVQRAAATLQKVQERNEPGNAEAEKMIATPASPPAQGFPVVSRNPAELPPAAQEKQAPPVRLGTAGEPALKLQAIYYRLKGPTVVINGRTLKLGDSVGGSKVIAIERNAVELERNGTKQKLTLP
ncbi:MAG TPA: hypothetical protein VK633_12620 [Verrucomicrobiae bacterium]|nr:hypothetical protein [Verrucomicrobiae bacterium]